MSVKTNILILFLLLGFAAYAAPGSKNACAQFEGDATTAPANDAAATAAIRGQIAQQTCDTQVWQAMASRAHLETEREIMQNQNLIFKADSILNYTCFDNFAAHASANVGVLFTHTTYWGREIIPWGPPNGMDYAMQNVVIASMEPYISSNFNHAYLGGRGPEYGLTITPEVRAVGSRGRTYSCNIMNQVWAVAKCSNFMHSDVLRLTDGFHPFINLSPVNGGQAVLGYENADINNVRRFPTACGGSPITGSDATTWVDLYRKSRNERAWGSVDRLYPYGQPLNTAFLAVREKVEPGTCGNFSVVRTGVQVILSAASAGQRYADGVCTNPGCTYRQENRCE